MNELININNTEQLNHAMKVCTHLATTSIVPSSFRGKPNDIFAALLLGSELGLTTMNALNSIISIQGNVTLKTQAMLGIAQAKLPEFDYTEEFGDDFYKVTAWRKKNGEKHSAMWDDKRASAMGLLNKENYRKQKITMFKWRCFSDVLRVVAADVLMGLSSTEEMIDVVESKEPTQVLLDDLKGGYDQLVQADMDKNPDHYLIGEGTFMVQNAKYRSKQLKDIDPEELADYLETLEARETKKGWEMELITSIRLYLGKLNAIEAGI